MHCDHCKNEIISVTLSLPQIEIQVDWQKLTTHSSKQINRTLMHNKMLSKHANFLWHFITGETSFLHFSSPCDWGASHERMFYRLRIHRNCLLLFVICLPVKMRSSPLRIWSFRRILTHKWIRANMVMFIRMLWISNGNS